MKKQYIVRRIEWNRTNDRGVPIDCIDIMNYFNKALKRGVYPLIPRTKPITEDEIVSLWVLGIDSKITYVAVDNDSQKVICGGTLLLDLENKIGELSITKDPDYSVNSVGTDVTKAVIEDALLRKITVIVHTSLENHSMRRIMEKLGYMPNQIIRDYEKYRGKIEAKNSDVYEWIIRPN